MRMRLATALLVSITASLLLHPATAAADPAPVSPRSAAFAYLGADASPDYVRLWPTGTASFRVRGTASVSIDIGPSSGSAYSVSVDDGAPQNHAVTCACRLPVAHDLTFGTHRIVVANTTPPGLDQDGAPIGAIHIEGWAADTPGAFREARAAFDYARVLESGSTLTLWTRKAVDFKIRWLANGAEIWVRLDDQFFNPYDLQAPVTGRVQGSMVAWGMSPGVRSVSISVVSGTLDLRRVILTGRPRSGPPLLIGEVPPTGTPGLASYGDSIIGGQGSVGGDGYAQRIATGLGYRLSNQAVAGTSARRLGLERRKGFELGCYGRQRVGNVVATNPSAVIVAYGVNNMLPGPDYWGCDGDLDDFRQAMKHILSELQASLPGIPVYVGAILPTPRVSEDTRAAWNQVLIDETAAHGDVFLDASGVLDLRTDYEDDRHPNNRGHAKIASYWLDSLSAA